MDIDALAAAEKRGYSKGYHAGRRKADRVIGQRNEQAKKNAFWNRAFLAAIPSCFECSGWKMDGKEVNGLDARIELAARVANEATKLMR